MVCLFHGDYGPADPAFNLGSGSTWVVDANSLTGARNLGEAEAIQRHLLRGEPVSWCDQGYVGRPGCRCLVLCRGLPIRDPALPDHQGQALGEGRAMAGHRRGKA